NWASVTRNAALALSDVDWTLNNHTQSTTTGDAEPDKLCGDGAYAIANVWPTASGAYHIAHEFGHVCGLWHTFSCKWSRPRLSIAHPSYRPDSTTIIDNTPTVEDIDTSPCCQTMCDEVDTTCEFPPCPCIRSHLVCTVVGPHNTIMSYGTTPVPTSF